MTTYTELVSQIRDYTEVDSSVLTDSIVNDFIEHAENRILRNLDLPVFRSYQFAQLTSGNEFLSLPGGTGITPVLFSAIRSLMIYPASGSGSRTFLEQKDITFMNEYWPNRDNTGTPKYYSQWDENTIYIAPTPSAAFYVELGFVRLPERLSSTTTSTWLSDNAPALLLYGSLAEAFKFLKGPADMLQLYEQSYQRALQEVASQQQGRGRRDEYMHGVLRVPQPSALPGLGSIKTTQGGQ